MCPASSLLSFQLQDFLRQSCVLGRRTTHFFPSFTKGCFVKNAAIDAWAIFSVIAIGGNRFRFDSHIEVNVGVERFSLMGVLLDAGLSPDFDGKKLNLTLQLALKVLGVLKLYIQTVGEMATAVSERTKLTSCFF
jgi:hypothetical protein